MVGALVLSYPRASNVYLLDTDASADGVSAALSQCLEGHEPVVARRKQLAAILSVSHLRPYLYGRQFWAKN